MERKEFAAGFDVPPGKALFLFFNYTGIDWNIDIGPNFMQAPAKQPDQVFSVTAIVIDPGSYVWQGHSPGGQYSITGDNGKKVFEFSVREGEVHEAMTQ